MQIDIWLKRVWLLIGVLILLCVLIGGILLLAYAIVPPNQSNGVLVGQNVHPKGADSLVIQDLSITHPRRVGRSDLLYIGVSVKELTSEIPASSMRFSEYKAPGYYRNLVNVVFSKSNGSDSYLLLDKKALIKTCDIPSELDSLQDYQLYEIAFEDTDHDGRITANDSSQLYISDIKGLNVTPITRKGDIVEWYDKSEKGNDIFILTREKQADLRIRAADWPERLYAYNVKEHKLSVFPMGGKPFEKIRELIWSK